MLQITETHQKLAGKLGLGNSERIPKLWAMLCDEDEAKIVEALPAKLEDIAAKTGKTPDEMKAALDRLYRKGVVFERVKDGVMTYNPPRNMVQFHDASALWPDATVEFLDLWREFMREEYPAFLKMIESAGFRPFMRVIPVNKELESRQEVLPYEHAAKMIEEATVHAVTNCSCRVTQRGCSAPTDVCLQLNRGAEYSIKRGTGRAVTKQEALEILDRAEKAGLIHLSENKSEIGNVLCNCCSCCCMAMEPFVHAGVKAFASPSRYKAAVDTDACTGCKACIPRCHVKAIEPKGAVVTVDQDACIGCGLCSSVCPTSAITLKEARPAAFIPK